MKFRDLTQLNRWRGHWVAIALGGSITLVLSVSVLAYAVGLGSQPSGTVTASALVAQIEADQAPLILDVRSPAEFAEGHIPGAVNIPHRALPDRIDTLALQPGQTVVVYCEWGVRASIAEDTLTAAGIDNIRHLTGDMVGWRRAGLPIEMPGNVMTGH